MVSSTLEINAYFDRIGYSGPVEPTLETLQSLHLAHLLAVPFENLDIHISREIVLEEDHIFRKIVRERRGGFCYEQNGLFAAVLREIGFDVTLLSARVSRPDGDFGPEFDHMLLRVDLDEPWLVDVGFGDSFRLPLRLTEGEQVQEHGSWRVEQRGSDQVLQRLGENGWGDQFAFTLKPRVLDAFSRMCYFHQTSPESHFTRNRVCSIATPDGRISLSGEKLTVTSNGVKVETPVPGDAAWHALLEEYFGITLPQPAIR